MPRGLMQRRSDGPRQRLGRPRSSEDLAARAVPAPRSIHIQRLSSPPITVHHPDRGCLSRGHNPIGRAYTSGQRNVW